MTWVNRNDEWQWDGPEQPGELALPTQGEWVRRGHIRVFTITEPTKPPAYDPTANAYRNCGTIAAYRRHLADGQRTCDACRTTMRKHRKAQRGHKKREVVDLQPCGTNAAFQRHYDHHEVPCDPCKAARRTYNREVTRKLRQSQREAA